MVVPVPSHMPPVPRTLTDSSGGTDPGTGIIAAIVDPAGGVRIDNLGLVAAATTTGKIAQKDISGAAPLTAGTLVQPDVPRNVVLTITDGDTGISAFTLVVTGKAPDGTVVTETFTFAGGLVQTGSVIFAHITSVIITAITGNGAGDTLDMGYGVKLGVGVPFGSTGLVIQLLTFNLAAEAAAATDTTNNSFTCTSSPDGAKEVKVVYSFVGLATTTIKAAIAQLAAKVNQLINLERSDA